MSFRHHYYFLAFSFLPALATAKNINPQFGYEISSSKSITPRNILDLGNKPIKNFLRAADIEDEIIEMKFVSEFLQHDRSLQQTTTLEISNDCDYNVYANIIFQRDQRIFQWKWPRIIMNDSLSIGDVEGSSFWIYAIHDSTSAPVWFSDGSEYCFETGDCFRRVDINTMQDTMSYLACNVDEVSEPQKTRAPTRAPTRPPTRVPTLEPIAQAPPRPVTRSPTRAPTRSPVSQPQTPQTRPPTRTPTRRPTQSPTQEPLAQAPPRPGSSSIKQQWLDEHNSRRQAFYELFPEYNLSPAPLKWSDSVARSAQNYANQLIALNGCTIQHGLNGDNYGGENLSSNWGSGSYATSRSPAAVLEAWYDDEIDLNRMQLVGQKYHATQAIWRSSRYLGCAQAEKNMSGNANVMFKYVVILHLGIAFSMDRPIIIQISANNDTLRKGIGFAVS
eukprot:CAMPEP_0194176768 /NCGR_PEP_ID=MMETSP0154-20130528/10642_1 /TAXON_ID=1049557 /ORGANISM="Thalassiothrix antarctica, Strain L6-D1" /LENGTH=445 /DNA_ID=CAMNT_0038891087 /DNA_START=89 /DNA_END=1427 /DNA_ORIENTATION=+